MVITVDVPVTQWYSVREQGSIKTTVSFNCTHLKTVKVGSVQMDVEWRILKNKCQKTVGTFTKNI